MAPVPKPPPKVPSQLWRSNRVNVIGDSISQRSADNSIGVISGLSWFTHAGWASDQRLRLYRNGGKSGDTTAQMAARLDADVLAFSEAGLCFVFGGTNDAASASVSNANADAVLATIDGMCVKIQSKKMQPAICTIPPRTDVTTYKDGVARINSRLRQYAAAHGYPLLDFFELLVDMTTGYDWKPGYSLDGIHPQHTISRLMGQYAATKIAPLLPPWTPYLTMWANDPVNMLFDGNFALDTNADGVSDGWTGDSGPTYSRIADSAVGHWQRINWTSAGAKTVQQGIATTFSVGDRLAWCCRFTTNVEAGGVQVYLGLSAIGSAVEPKRSRIDAISTDVTNGLAYGEFVIQDAATTGVAFQVFNSATGTGSVDIARATVINLTRMGYA